MTFLNQKRRFRIEKGFVYMPRQDLLCMYLAHHEPESMSVIRNHNVLDAHDNDHISNSDNSHAK